MPLLRTRSIRPRSPLATLLPFIVLSLACRSDSLGPPLEFENLPGAELDIVPSELILPDGSTGFFSVRALSLGGTGGGTLPAGAQVQWKSSAPGVASVGSTGGVTAKAPGLAMITATAGGETVSATVIVQPTASDLRPLLQGELTGVVGASLPDSVGVRVVDRGGLPIPGVKVTFAVDMGGGSVFPSQARTGPDGTAKTTWKMGTTAGENALSVRVDDLEPLYLIARAGADEDPEQLLLIGGDQQSAEVGSELPQELVVRVVDQYGNPVANAPIRWDFNQGGSSGGAAGGAGGAALVADQSGYARVRWRLGDSAGDQLATATFGTKEVWFQAKGRAGPPKSVTILPSSISLGVNQSAVLTASVWDRKGNLLPSEPVSWASNGVAIAQVDASGRVTGRSAGTTTVIATVRNIDSSPSAILVQGQSIAGLRAVSGSGQSGPTSSALPQPFVVKVVDGSGIGVSGVPVSWTVTSGGGSLSSQSTSTDAQGTARVTLTLGPVAGLNGVKADASGLPSVNFLATGTAGTVSAVQITPGAASLSPGQILQMSATALDGSGNPIAGKSFTWSSSNSAVATVNGTGKVTGVADGTTNILAFVDGQTGTAVVSVTRAVGGVSIAQDAAQLNAIGDQVRLDATVVDAQGNPMTGVSVSWSSSSSSIATVDQLGRVTSKGVGVAIIAAVAGCCAKDSTIVDVSQVPAAVAVTPANATADVGGTVQFVAQVTDSNGVAVVAAPPVTWSSSDPAVATVSQSGVAVAVAAGSSAIEARLASGSGSNAAEGEGNTGGTGVAGAQTLVVQGGTAPPPPPPPPPPSGPTPALPQVYLNTSYQQPGGNVIDVPAGGNLQAAINQAARGDIIRLAAGATYSGSFKLPQKSGSGWIVITTNTTLPPQGTRMTPAAAGSLAKIEGSGWEAAINAEVGSAFYRIMGVEIRIDANTTSNGGIVRLGRGDETAISQMPTDIILDRVYIFGHANLDTKRCVALNGLRMAVVDSYLAGCHAKGQDSQAVSGWNGPGPYKIVNNFLEAAGENVMFGGSDPRVAGVVPSDIEIRGNHLYKPLSWRTSGRWTVKNLFELKNAKRVLFENNILENVWPDGQVGFAILVKSTNQSGGCTWCTSQDVTIRYNLIEGAAHGFNIAPHGSSNTNSPVTARVLLQHNVFTGSGTLFQVLGAVEDLAISHNTGFDSGRTMSMSGGSAVRFLFMDNIAERGQYGIKGDATGEGTATLNKFAAGGTTTGNLLIGANSSLYPSGNGFPGSVGAVGFVDAANGDYRLASNSQYKGWGSGGSDPGADAAALSGRIAGVR